MPESQWTKPSKAVKQHLMDRLKDRHITPSDMQALQEWIVHSPQVPRGKWYKTSVLLSCVGRRETLHDRECEVSVTADLKKGVNTIELVSEPPDAGEYTDFLVTVCEATPLQSSVKT